mmetsp:Transcript_96336/g.278072  ORF Transcript_96336/g.278072 Transcript_96336/m.278072 type:complete len:675 (+) Transcript_96336:117-2141(+)
MPVLDAELERLLRGDLFHGQVRAYLEAEGCTTVGLFRCWVDSASEWSTLLCGGRLVDVGRAHVAHIKDCWEQAKQRQVEVSRTGVLPPGGPPHHIPLLHNASHVQLTAGGHVSNCKLQETISGDAEFWKGLIGSRLSTTEMRCISNLTVADLCDLLTTTDDVRIHQAFERFDLNGDGHMDRRELDAALEFLGMVVHKDCSDRIFRRLAGASIQEDTPGVANDTEELTLTPKVFQGMLKRLRLAELFTPSAGNFRWDEGEETSPASTVFVVDYTVEACNISNPLEKEQGERFFFGSRRASKHFSQRSIVPSTSSPIRWVHMGATKGLDRLTLLRLAVKYNLHPLAVDDVLDNRTATKIDRYGNDLVVSLDIVVLANTLTFDGEPPRVRICRSHATIFLAGPPDSDTLVTIHQERDDKSSWLEMWHRGARSGESVDGSSMWADMLLELQRGRGGSSGADSRRPPSRVRQEKADFLMYEVLHRVVLQFRPIAEAYAKRLGWMRQRPVRNLNQACMDEVEEVKLELYDFVRSIRPLKQVVKHFIDEGIVGGASRMYLDDVLDAIESMIEDIGHLMKMAETLESAHERHRDKKMNDLLFALSILSGIFMPLQFWTGWYGMNFENMPELSWSFGYEYFIILELACFVGSVTGILLLRHGDAPPWTHPRRWWCGGTKVHSE